MSTPPLPLDGNRVPDLYAVPAFRELPSLAREALIVLWSSGDTPLHGLLDGYAAAVRISGRLSISAAKARSMIGYLVAAGFAQECHESGLLWLLSYIELRLGASPAKNLEKWGRSTARALRKFPQTKMVVQFARLHGLQDLLDANQAGGAVAGRASRRVSDRVSGRVLQSVPDGDGVHAAEPTGRDAFDTTLRMASGGGDAR